MDEGAPHEVLIRQARSALAEGSASEETMVRMQLLVKHSARCSLLHTCETAISDNRKMSISAMCVAAV